MSKSLTELHATIRESSNVSKVEVLVCLGTDVSSEVKKQKPSGDLGAKLPKADDKTAGKKLLNFFVVDNII